MSDSFTVGDALDRNDAATFWSDDIATWQVWLVPVHAPLQPVNVCPGLGVALTVTFASAACGDVQPVPVAPLQLSPAPDTVPPPVTDAVRLYVVLSDGSKLASAVLALETVRVHEVRKPVHAPSHPSKSEELPLAATADSTTTDPC